MKTSPAKACSRTTISFMRCYPVRCYCRRVLQRCFPVHRQLALSAPTCCETEHFAFYQSSLMFPATSHSGYSTPEPRRIPSVFFFLKAQDLPSSQLRLIHFVYPMSYNNYSLLHFGFICPFFRYLFFTLNTNSTLHFYSIIMQYASKLAAHHPARRQYIAIYKDGSHFRVCHLFPRHHRICRSSLIFLSPQARPRGSAGTQHR